jgi:iron complex outermembrane receptor protein
MGKQQKQNKLLQKGSGTAIGALLLLYAQQAYAADYFDLSPEQLLGAQVVSASRMKQSVSETPAAVYVISQEDIARSGMNSVPELLRMVPGVNVAKSDSNTWAISIRGFNGTNSNKLLVMIDDRAVYNPLVAGTFWDLQDTPLEDIERIEVIRGPGGTLWGSNAVNGVINIITKNADKTQGNLVSGGAGNYERAFATARHGGVLGGDNNGAYRVYAKYNNHDDFHSLGANHANDDWQNYRAGFRADWGDGGPDHATLHGDVYHVDSGAKYSSYFLNAPYSEAFGETIEADGANIMGGWEHGYDDGSSLKLESYLDYTSHEQNVLQDHRYLFNTDAQYNFKRMGRNELIAGGNFRVLSDDIGGSSLVTFDPPSRTDTVGSLFVQDKITLQPEHWFLTLGSKFERSLYTGLEIQPNARLEWMPDANNTVWASVSRAIRTPSRTERDLNITNLIVGPGIEPDPSIIVLTENKNFDSEKLIAYEAGYRKQVTPDVSLDATAFANDYQDLSSAIVPAPGPIFVPAGVDPAHWIIPLVATNQMTGEVYGAELAASWKVAPNWKLSGGYTHLEMFLHSPKVLGFTQEAAEGRSPRNQLNLRSFWNINSDWTLDTMVYYVDGLASTHVPSYIRTDVNVGWHVSQGLQFNLIGQNLFDNAHREFNSATDINSTEVPRSVFGKLTWQF